MKNINVVLSEEKLRNMLKCKHTCANLDTVDCSYCEDSRCYEYSEDKFKKSLKELRFKEI